MFYLLFMFLELAIQPTLNASLMQRSSTDASAAGQSTSGGGNGNDNNNQLSQQPTLNQTDITIQSADSTTVKANVGDQQQPGQQGGGVIAATASSMG